MKGRARHESRKPRHTAVRRERMRSIYDLVTNDTIEFTILPSGLNLRISCMGQKSTRVPHGSVEHLAGWERSQYHPLALGELPDEKYLRTAVKLV